MLHMLHAPHEPFSTPFSTVAAGLAQLKPRERGPAKSVPAAERSGGKALRHSMPRRNLSFVFGLSTFAAEKHCLNA